MNRAARATGVIWEGESPLDGAPLVAIATYAKGAKAANEKTGRMVQVYILRRDIAPLEAVQTGADVSICGHCPMRSSEGVKGRGCYVNVGQSPTAVWSKYKAGGYGLLPDLTGLPIRWGAYGDPAMLPADLVEQYNAMSSGWTGYTHQWRHAWAEDFEGVFMASVETPEQERKALEAGWSTFRVGLRDGSDIGSATLCRNERDGSTCAECLECDGGGDSFGRAIYIPAHGWGAKNIPAERLVRNKKQGR